MICISERSLSLLLCGEWIRLGQEAIAVLRGDGKGSRQIERLRPSSPELTTWKVEQIGGGGMKRGCFQLIPGLSGVLGRVLEPMFCVPRNSLICRYTG